MRVPTQNVSMIDLSLQLKRSVTKEEVKNAFQQATAGSIGSVLAYNELPLVSTDYIGNDKSATIDGLSTMARGDQVKLFAWYDNEWAYASRVYDLARHIQMAQNAHTRTMVGV